MHPPILISETMIFDGRLSMGDIRVYSAIVRIAAGMNNCVASKKQIAQISGMGRVCRHTKNLCRFGYLKIEQQKQGDFNLYVMPYVIPLPEATPTYRLSTFLKEYLEYSIGVHSKNTTRTYSGCMRELISYVGDVPLASIDVRMMEQFLSHKKLSISAYTARRHYISLKSIFERAVVWGLIESNPLKKIKQPKVPDVEISYFNKHQLQNFLSLIEDEEFRELVLVAFYTSLRRGELLALRWRDIDLSKGFINVRNSEFFTTKSCRNRTIGICNGLLAILIRRKEKMVNDVEWVFSNSNGEPLNGNTVSKKFKSYCRKAGLDARYRFHGLRHSGATLMLAMGAPSFAVQRHLGHRRLQTTEHYLHASQLLLQQTVDKLPLIETTNV